MESGVASQGLIKFYCFGNLVWYIYERQRRRYAYYSLLSLDSDKQIDRDIGKVVRETIIEASYGYAETPAIDSQFETHVHDTDHR